MNIWGFYVLAVRNSAAMSINISIYEDILSTSLGYLSRNGIAGSHVNSIFKFVGTTNSFPSCCTILHPHQQSMRVLIRHVPDNGCYCLYFLTVAMLSQREVKYCDFDFPNDE